MLWELGWVEESIDLLSLVPSLGMVADCITTLTRLWKEVAMVSLIGLCLSFFLPIGLEVSLCQQRRKELTVDSSASLCSNSFEAAWWEGWRFMVDACLMEQAQKMGWFLQVHLLRWTYHWCGCCDWYEFQGYVRSLSVP